jgi:TonB family protein
MNREHGPLVLALLFSLLAHTLLLSLTFGGREFGLPGFAFPWRERRIAAPDLRVVLVPARVAPAEPAVESAVASVPADERMAEALPGRSAVAPAAPANAPVRVDGPGPAVPSPPFPQSAVVDVERSDLPAPVVPEAPPAPTSMIALAQSTSSPETVTSATREAGEAALEAARQAAARLEAARLEAERQEAARQEAAQREAERQEAARQAAARAEAARLEVERQDAARQAAARVETERQEATRQEAARVEAARQEAARVEAARRETERQQAARLAAARQEAARVLAEQEEDARREARRRALGRQLDEEAARREAAAIAARPSSALPLSLSTARRARLWGRSDPNAELIRYAEAWARKIQFNTTVDTVREVAMRPHTNPMVTVAIRSDGSVESVTFVLSSGVPEVDEAIRRIVQSHAHYPAFPPGLASEFDVVEIRRTWNFDAAVRLY